MIYQKSQALFPFKIDFVDIFDKYSQNILSKTWCYKKNLEALILVESFFSQITVHRLLNSAPSFELVAVVRRGPNETLHVA